jgi:hypothetical protein
VETPVIPGWTHSGSRMEAQSMSQRRQFGRTPAIIAQLRAHEAINWWKILVAGPISASDVPQPLCAMKGLDLPTLPPAPHTDGTEGDAGAMRRNNELVYRLIKGPQDPGPWETVMRFPLTLCTVIVDHEVPSDSTAAACSVGTCQGCLYVAERQVSRAPWSPSVARC